MDDSKLWHIHGERYDLTPFLDKHPGGKAILITTQGLPDATPLFESYHAFANYNYIRKTLQTYQVSGPGYKSLYTYDSFYEEIVRRARSAFGAKSDSESVTSKIKASNWWWFKITVEFIAMIALWIATFVAPVTLDSSHRFGLGLATGCLFISLGFNTMHDASHFAISSKRRWLNGFFLRIWTAWALWSGSFWMTHHVVRHHGFTGHPDLDPDIQHARPFIRKSNETPREKYVFFPQIMKEVWHFALVTASVFAFLPGMFVGQVLSYSLLWPLRGHLWKMPLPKRGSFDKTWWESLLAFLSLFTQVYFFPSFYASLGYFVGCNVAYAICILPDHDTFESAVENHVNVDQGETPDWGEIQVRHSSEVGIGFWGRLYGEMAGGINYQIVHHLFPGVSHVHYPMLTEIVEQYCLEKSVPFVRHSSLSSALWSVAKTFTTTMSSPSPLSQEVSSVDKQSVKVEKESRPYRHTDMVKGMLFGVWLTLCSVALAKHVPLNSIESFPILSH
jgi:fatty acid desaturase